tara:strand:+ start:4308 stop:5276 length:969 start_codon:yes stop_codon:yes gene_type:complete
MAFLDNSGDIILDAVLTDTGRFRMAKGDGSFKITKFAFADDEINYGRYNKTHASGSAYYDLELLQTPVLEAFTNNTSNMKYKLMSIARTNLLYLPVMKLNTTFGVNDSQGHDTTVTEPEGMFVVCVDTDTESHFSSAQDGIINGVAGQKGYIKIDQGLDTTQISPSFNLDNDLIENSYIIELDSRLGRISSADGATVMEESFIDDDQIATYFVSTTDPHVTQIQSSKKLYVDEPAADDTTYQTVISGPRGTTLDFAVRASIELNSNKYLFEKFGNTSETSIGGKAAGSGYTYGEIDTVVRVTGATTGYRLDIPVKFVKLIAT